MRVVQSVAFPYLYLEGKFPNNVLEVQIHADISPGEELLSSTPSALCVCRIG